MNKKVFMIAVIALAIDQITKIIVGASLSFGETLKICDFFSITNVYNTGAAFSILEGKTVLLTVLSICVLIVIVKMMQEFKVNLKNTLAFGLMVGGILGNFSDRLFLGMVRDFLKFKIFGYNFPVFNVADVCIVVGVGLIMISIFKGEDKSESSSRNRRECKTR